VQDATINNYTYTKSSVKLTLKDHKGNKIDLIATTEVEKLTNSDRLNTKCGDLRYRLRELPHLAPLQDPTFQWDIRMNPINGTCNMLWKIMPQTWADKLVVVRVTNKK